METETGEVKPHRRVIIHTALEQARPDAFLGEQRDVLRLLDEA